MKITLKILPMEGEAMHLDVVLVDEDAERLTSGDDEYAFRDIAIVFKRDDPDVQPYDREGAPKCKSCGKYMVDHLGLYGTCERLLKAEKEVERTNKHLKALSVKTRGLKMP